MSSGSTRAIVPGDLNSSLESFGMAQVGGNDNINPQKENRIDPDGNTSQHGNNLNDNGLRPLQELLIPERNVMRSCINILPHQGNLHFRNGMI